MTHLSYGTAGSVIMDVAALCFLGGILVYTSFYRRRGRLHDKLFLAMTVVNIVMAAADGMNFLLLESNISGRAELMTGGDTVFSICFEFFPYLYVLYMDYRLNRSEERLVKWKFIYGIPFFLSLGMILLNIRFGYLFYVEGSTNEYKYGSYYNLIFIPVVIYSVIVIIQFARVNWRMILLFLTLVLCRVIWGIWFRDISSTAFLYALFLAYTHIYVMNRSLSG